MGWFKRALAISFFVGLVAALFTNEIAWVFAGFFVTMPVVCTIMLFSPIRPEDL